MKIPKSVAQEFLQRLGAQQTSGVQRVTHEFQDEWRFLLVTVDVDDTLSQDEIVSFLRKTQEIAEAILPWRRGEYSWMVNVRKGGEVVESAFGGDLESPRSGLIQ